MVQYGRPSRFLLSEIFTIILWQDYHGKSWFEKVLLEYDWESVPNWEYLFAQSEKGFFFSVYVDDIMFSLKEIKTMDPMWKVLNKTSSLGRTLYHSSIMYILG